MKFKNIQVVFFSPTGGTRKVVMTVAKILGDKMQLPILPVNFTLPSQRNEIRRFSSDSVVVLGTPTYAGRVPNKILPIIQTMFFGENTPVIPIVTFGNRSMDNSLRELSLELGKNQFQVFAAAGIVCRHAFSDDIGHGRPDALDMEKLTNFACNAAERLIQAQSLDNLGTIEIEGNPDLSGYYVPLGESGKPVQFLKAKPKTIEEKCDHCGACAKLCPMGAIDTDDESIVPGTCIKCQACVRICHTKAKYFDDENFLSHVRMLKRDYQRYAESKFWGL